MNTSNETNIENEVQLIKIAIDMHLKSYRVVRQLDHSMVQPAQRFEPKRFYRWLEKQKGEADRIAVCYEAGCFGYEPARRMQAMGVEVYVIAPQNWDEQGKRQVNDKHDAAVMCRRRAFSRATVSGNAPDGGQGSQSLIAERDGSEGTLVAGSDLEGDPRKDAQVGREQVGDLERIY